jgi:4-alpha-glucanotransferase
VCVCVCVCVSFIRDADYVTNSSRPCAVAVSVTVQSLNSAGSVGIGDFSDIKPLVDWLSQIG